MQEQSKVAKQLRQELNRLGIQAARGIKFPSRSVSLFNTHLEEARMQMGAVLRSLGSEAPYPTTGELAPAQDLVDVNSIEDLAGTTQEDKLHTLRGILEVHIKEVENLAIAPYNPGSFAFTASLTGAYNSLRLAKNWLGVALVEAVQKSQGDAPGPKTPVVPDDAFKKDKEAPAKDVVKDSELLKKSPEKAGIQAGDLNKTEKVK